MMIATLFALLFLCGAYSAPTETPNTNADSGDKFTVTKDTFAADLIRYESKYDIVNIQVPINSLNFEDSSEESDENDDGKIATLFFVEQDLKTKELKGLYVLRNYTATKLLENGRDITSPKDSSKTVYFGAKDGIYKYNHKKGTAEKYGTISDSIIGITMGNDTGVIYILTEDKLVYRVTDDGNKKVKIEEIKNAQQIIMDSRNNLYYYDNKNQIYVLNEGGVKNIKGAPENVTQVLLLRAPVVLEEGIPIILDDKIFIVYPNATIETSSVDLQMETNPTAYSLEGTFLIYIAKDKKIYEYNLLIIIFGELLNELKKFLEPAINTIQALSTKSIRSDSISNSIF